VLNEKFGEADSSHFAYAIAAGSHGWPEAETLLTELISNNNQAAIVRATAVSLLPPYLSNRSAPTLQMVAQSDEPILKLGLASVADSIPSQYRPAFVIPLLYDSNRVTRGLSASSLSGLPLSDFPVAVQQHYDVATDEYLASSMFNADRPETLTNLANYYQQQGMTLWAVDFFQQAIDIAPYYTPAYINFADYYRNQGDEKAAQNILQKALDRVRDKAVVHHALGLSLVREQRFDQALIHLKMAAETGDTSGQFNYVYAIALNSKGDADKSLQILEEAQQQYPNNQTIVAALVSINRDLGREQDALRYEKLMPFSR
jgi:tetratricopeptide (TPR) repeat protein